MGYRTLLRDHRGLLGIAFLAMFTSSLGQSFFIGLFQAPIAERLDLTAGQFGTAYALVTLVAGFAMLRLGTVRATLSAAMVFSTGIAPAVLGMALDLGASFSQVLVGMLALLATGWALAQGVLASPEARGD